MKFTNFELLWNSTNSKHDFNYKSCIHSGNASDIIYSLPIVRMLEIEHFIINVHSGLTFDKSGRTNMSLEVAHFLCPLLLKQPYIKKVSIVKSDLPSEFLGNDIEGINFNLDKFRLQEIFKHHLAICYAKMFGIYLNLFEGWLFVDSKIDYRDDYIVIFLTSQYRSLSDKYWVKSLSGLKNIIVLGSSKKFFAMIGNSAKFIACADFLEMAKIIASAKMFIGNPSLASAIAEGLKIPRIIELPQSPRNAYPIGRHGYTATGSIVEDRNLIECFISSKSNELLVFQNITHSKEIARFEAKNNLTKRVITNYCNLRDKLFPRGSKRREFVKKLKMLYRSEFR